MKNFRNDGTGTIDARGMFLDDPSGRFPSHGLCHQAIRLTTWLHRQ